MLGADSASSSMPSRPYTQRYIAPTVSIYSPLQKHIIQTVATATSAITICATLITFYLFTRMRKRFRHELVMFSILGCFIRGLWYFMFSIVVLQGRTVPSASAFCQATGFFTQVGNEMYDISTFLIAVHGAIQIFRPSIANLDIHDGLEAYRKYCYAAIVLLPITMASLAFVNEELAYTSQGAFCALPTSPIVYRLALAWVPRFCIAGSMIGLALAVYIHVEVKLRSFAASQQNSRTSIAVPYSPTSIDENMSSTVVGVTTPMVEAHGRRLRLSLPTSNMPGFWEPSMADTVTPMSMAHSPRATWRAGNANLSPADATNDYFTANGRSDRMASTTTTGSRETATSTSSRSRVSIPGLAKIKRTTTQAAQRVSIPSSRAPLMLSPQERQEAERRALRRQLRIIFVYPLMYVLLWIPPSILTIMQFTPRWMYRLPPTLAIVAAICVTLMGAIDCAVFLWREKPWRRRMDHRGSMASTRTADIERGPLDMSANPVVDPPEPCSKTSFAKSLVASLSPTRSSQSRNASSGTTGRVGRELAYERLALEKQDRRDAAARMSTEDLHVTLPPPLFGGLSPLEEVKTAASDNDVKTVGMPSPEPTTPGTKDWFDRKESLAFL